MLFKEKNHARKRTRHTERHCWHEIRVPAKILFQSFQVQKKKLSGIKKISLKQTWNRLSDCKVAKKKHKRNQFSIKTLLSKKEHLINLETSLV